MCWKKNAISYIMWFLYVLLAEALVLICADDLGQRLGLSVYVSAALAFAYAALIGVIVLLMRLMMARFSRDGQSRKLAGLIVEAVLCVGLLAAGLMLRISNMDAMTQSAAYFETAQVTYGQSIPQIVHGAVYLYLQALHGLFLLVGNHFVAGIWLQIVLQMLAFVILYFVVRKMSGAIAALITLGFGMCAPMMVQYALTLSPEILYFLMAVLVLAVFMVGCGRKLHPALFLLFGGLAAVMTYLDVAGVFLFVFAAAMPFMLRAESAGVGRKMAALGCTVVSYAGIFAGTIFLDAFFSGKVFLNVLKAWIELYVYKSYGSVNAPFAVEEVILIGLLVVGIFSFWCDKKAEVISVSMCSMIAYILLAFRFTEEMNGELYCYLILFVMAGTFVGQVFSGKQVVLVGADVHEILSEEEIMPQESAVISATEEAMGMQEQKAAEGSVSDGGQTDNTVRPAVQFIENPLPLPKKHEKKVLDYAVELTEETAEFDLEVADDDDYDN